MIDTVRSQRGAAVIEFALMLPFLLAIAVGIIYYGYAFVLKSAVENAARNGAQEIVAVSPLTSGYSDALLRARARTVVQASVAWLPASVSARIADDEAVQLVRGGRCDTAYGVSVSLVLTGGDNPVLPQFTLGKFRIPPLARGGVQSESRMQSTACVTL
ncbi:TadE/TadG family type IV pilus assembly protein [Salinisphaera aquimarina]|uniref:TadE/TadG family type IV pilus assembly protein n=1 Tax=Salinisphaera aquimarina TaxID=2094031 RepID=A0ABV7EXE4_9GAMM